MLLFVPSAFSSTNNFAHAQTLYRMSSLCRSYECMNIVRVNIGVLTGWKNIKQRRISFVLGYLRMILWKISSAISIKPKKLAAFNKKKSILTACMPLSTITPNQINLRRIQIHRVQCHIRGRRWTASGDRYPKRRERG